MFLNWELLRVTSHTSIGVHCTVSRNGYRNYFIRCFKSKATLSSN